MHLIVVIWLTVPESRKGIFSVIKTPMILIFFIFCVEGLENNYCFICFKCLVVFAIFTANNTSNILLMTAIMKLDGTNYQKWKKTLGMNLTFMKLDLALEIDPLEKLTY